MDIRSKRAVLLRSVARSALAAVMLVLAGCGGNDRASEPPTNTVGVSPAQANYDSAVAQFDQIAVPIGGEAVLSASAIVATQSAFDKIADELLAL